MSSLPLRCNNVSSVVTLSLSPSRHRRSSGTSMATFVFFLYFWSLTFCIILFLTLNLLIVHISNPKPICVQLVYILAHFSCTRVHVSKCTQNHPQTFWFFILVHHHNCTNDTWSFDCFNFFLQTFKIKQLSIWFSKKKLIMYYNPMLMQLSTYVHIFKCIIKWIKRTKIKS